MVRESNAPSSLARLPVAIAGKNRLCLIRPLQIIYEAE